ncbi:hypothetical protein R3I94_000266 [Phoxinus phoxinus]|uniref:PiggyBac transposable element-derived protein domain-containing protein n=1 Tax=Phoxinus phoxinus TaxID=58324 RepID=A0AAN9HHF1_9TELE
MLSTRIFYGKRGTVVPAHPSISDDEGSEEEDDDVADPDFLRPTHNLDTPGQSDIGPSAKRKCVQPAVEVLDDDDDDDDDNDEEPAPQAKRSTKKGKPAARLTTWRKDDLDNAALPKYQHCPPDFIETPFQYFSRYFSPQVVKHIKYQTNLYANQKNINLHHH